MAVVRKTASWQMQLAVIIGFIAFVVATFFLLNSIRPIFKIGGDSAHIMQN